MPKTSMQISEIARLLGITPKTVRHYYKLGLLPEPTRSEARYRLYSAADLFHLRRIRRLQGLGLSLQQIKSIQEADDPDGLLRTTLETLHADLNQQQQRIEARRGRIAQYLAEEASLAEIEQPDSPSPTYERLKQSLGDVSDLIDVTNAFDNQVFAQWDDLNLGEGYATTMNAVVGYFEAADQIPGFRQIIERMALLQTMAEDDARIQLWAEEAKESGLRDMLSGGSQMPEITPPVAEVMKHIFRQSADQHLTAAQRRFLELLIA